MHTKVTTSLPLSVAFSLGPGSILHPILSANKGFPTTAAYTGNRTLLWRVYWFIIQGVY